MEFNFDFSYIKGGAPIVTLSSFGIAFNKGSIDALGNPEKVIIGYDDKNRAIGIRAKNDDDDNPDVPSFDFARRVKNDWVRIGAKDFIKYLSKITGINCIDKAKQFIAEYDDESNTLIVIIDEEHLK